MEAKTFIKLKKINKWKNFLLIVINVLRDKINILNKIIIYSETKIKVEFINS